MKDSEWIELLERRVQIKNAKTLDYLKAYYADLEYQFKQDGVEYMNQASCGTPEHLTDEGAKKYLADLADFIAKEEAA
jgi:hypothetical protein